MRRATAIRDSIVVVGNLVSVRLRLGNSRLEVTIVTISRHVTFLLHHHVDFPQASRERRTCPLVAQDKLYLLPDIQVRQASSKRAFASSAVSRKGVSFIVGKPYPAYSEYTRRPRPGPLPSRSKSIQAYTHGEQSTTSKTSRGNYELMLLSDLLG